MKVDDYIKAWKTLYRLKYWGKIDKEDYNDLKKILKSGLTYKQLKINSVNIDIMKKLYKKEIKIKQY